jgi:hypothetical protein
VSVPAGPGVVERGQGEYFPGGCWVTGFWGLKEWVAPSASERGFAARMGVKRPEMGSKRRLWGQYATWHITAQLLLKNTFMSRDAVHESQTGFRRNFPIHNALRRKHGALNF